MGITINFYNTLRQRGNNYIGNIQRVYEHKVTYSLVERELYKKNSINSVTHDLDKLILFILGFPRKFITKFHRKHSEHHVESHKPLNLKSMLCDNIASSPYFKTDKKQPLREYFNNSELNKICGLKELMEKFNYGEHLDFVKIKNNVNNNYRGFSGFLHYIYDMIQLLFI